MKAFDPTTLGLPSDFYLTNYSLLKGRFFFFLRLLVSDIGVFRVRVQGPAG